MSPEQRSALAQLARLRRELTSDHGALASRLSEAREISTRWEREPPEEPWLTVAAVVLHAWYTGLETLLERVARLLDENVPRGDAFDDVLEAAQGSLTHQP